MDIVTGIRAGELKGNSISDETYEEFRYDNFTVEKGLTKNIEGISKFGTIDSDGVLTFSVAGLYSVNSSALIINTNKGQIYNFIMVNDKMLARSFNDMTYAGIPASTTFYANIGDRLKVYLQNHNYERSVTNWRTMIYKIF